MPGFFLDLLKPLKTFFSRKTEVGVSTGDIHAPTVIQNNYVTINISGPVPEEGLLLPEIPEPPEMLSPGERGGANS